MRLHWSSQIAAPDASPVGLQCGNAHINPGHGGVRCLGDPLPIVPAFVPRGLARTGRARAGADARADCSVACLPGGAWIVRARSRRRAGAGRLAKAAPSPVSIEDHDSQRARSDPIDRLFAGDRLALRPGLAAPDPGGPGSDGPGGAFRRGGAPKRGDHSPAGRLALRHTAGDRGLLQVRPFPHNPSEDRSVLGEAPIVCRPSSVVRRLSSVVILRPGRMQRSPETSVAGRGLSHPDPRG